MLNKPYPLLCRKTPPCSKGIKTYHRFAGYQAFAVERHRPVPKGLKPLIHFFKVIVISCRKTLPCSKGIETFRNRFRADLLSRKTPPCSKGIETLNPCHSFTNSISRKTPPCSKGIETCEATRLRCFLYVERPRPVPKGLRQSPVCDSNRVVEESKDPALF